MRAIEELQRERRKDEKLELSSRWARELAQCQLRKGGEVEGLGQQRDALILQWESTLAVAGHKEVGDAALTQLGRDGKAKLTVEIDVDDRAIEGGILGEIEPLLEITHR